MSDICMTCRKPMTPKTYITLGYLGTYVECDFCFNGKVRPAEPEFITDTFTQPQPRPTEPEYALNAILDKMTGEGES